MKKWALSICGVCDAERGGEGVRERVRGFRGERDREKQRQRERENEGSGDDFVLVYCLLPS